ncbi:Bug family tripartite tricarboxylate transporter substrate binding protein [Bordetella petrii]|uniref:Bug family tripartite tricarboxylate transporter substrate binding protein n=1 Tax=Bordetella petrii TaxID=94624 RepID=UPI001E4D1ED9|nr:tripartite tricarboxylate transporter substrate binding protein [Bordetella petrii]MCD0504579.1 tripartite tricarboxylate transporter substrate binding protein [Bordetella petrii]
MYDWIKRGAVALGCALSMSAQGAAWPAKPVTLLVGFPPGQATDAVARMLAERLSKNLQQPVVVENRPGQGGSIALAALAKAPADGYTMMLSATASLVTNPHLYKSTGYQTLSDFSPVGLVADLPMILVANAAAPFNDMAELRAYARSHPGALNYSSSGNGTLSHLGMVMLQREMDVKLTHIPYQGSVKAMTDMIAGNVTVGLDTVAVTLPHILSGRLKAIAVAADQRLPQLPDVPTVAEAGYPDFRAQPWLGMLYPKGTPVDVVRRMNDEMRAAMTEPAMTRSLQSIGAVPRTDTSEAFAALLRSEYSHWGELVRLSGSRVD